MRGSTAKEMIYGTYFLVRFKTVVVKLEDGLDIKISVKTRSRDAFFVSLAVKLHRLKVERMHFHMDRR